MKPFRTFFSSPAGPLCCLLGILLGAGSFTFSEAEGLSYLGNASETCVNCHIMREQFDGWLKSSHHAVATCNDCHVPHAVIPKYLVKGENGFSHSKAFTLQNFHEPIQIQAKSRRIVLRNCLRCHGAVVDEMLERSRQVTDGDACIRCHGQVGHGASR